MTYDLLGIGLGPFNLGLAALSHDIPSLTTAFIEQKDNFDWHPGLLLPGARLQVPFYSDLVTLVQPTSRFSWFSFLQAKQRLFRFGVQDNPFPLRKEYNEYGQWVAGQLSGLCFGHRVVGVYFQEEDERYAIQVLEIKTGKCKTFHAKHLVIGTGTIPCFPKCTVKFSSIEHDPKQNMPLIIHAANYLSHRDQFAKCRRITVVGSGQSAAEVFQDACSIAKNTLSWFTRSPRFFPMETTPAAFELASSDYRHHFYRLPPAMKEFILAGQDALYKGINSGLLTSIYERLYERLLDNPADRTTLCPNSEIVQLEQDRGEWQCIFRHGETGLEFEHRTDALILATGYRAAPLTILDGVRNRLNFLPRGEPALSANYSITDDQTIFLQNHDTHTHGFASADLSFGPYRNAVILHSILGYNHFQLEEGTTFQQFSGPQGPA